MRDIEMVLKKFEGLLMQLPNVTGVGIGEKQGNEVIKVFVKRKVPEAGLRPGDVVPKISNGFTTDVEVEIAVGKDQGSKVVTNMAHFEIFKNKGGQYRWRLRAANNKIIADSAESYVRKSACMHGIRLLKSCSSKAKVTDKRSSEPSKNRKPNMCGTRLHNTVMH